MDLPLIDWNEIWRKQQPRTFDEERNRSYWNKRAKTFSRPENVSPYVDRFLNLLQPEPHWRVLDVGCAAGTLAVPLASRVCQVTGLDISPHMLAALQETCRAQNIQNIRPVEASWNDDWQSLGIEPHEVVIASRSVIVPDLRQAIVKLNRFATSKVCIAIPVGTGPFDPLLLRAIGRPSRCGADYICVVNLLYQMGLRASLNFITYEEESGYQDEAEAFRAHQRRLGELTADEEQALRQYLRTGYIRRDGRWQRADPLRVSWAVLAWSPVPEAPDCLL